MIGVEWGRSSFRAFRVTKEGTVRDRRSVPRGVANVPNGRFGETLREEIGPWLAAGEEHVLLSGMIGSRQGWKDAPSLPCPAGAAELAAGLVDIGFDWAKVKLVPGLTGADDAGVAEEMRGEETPVMGIPDLLRSGGLACLPGEHTRWVRVENERIVGFSTHMSGEVFAALRGSAGIGRMMRDGPINTGWFDKGLARSADGGGVLHHLCGVRTLIQTGELKPSDAPAYMSGILTGYEVRSALADAGNVVVQVIGLPEQTALYARGVALAGGYAERHDGEATARGLALIAAHAKWG